jgi:hypothetical protein
MYFRSLSLLATFACAGLTIAAPLGASGLNNLLGDSAFGVSASKALPAAPPIHRDVASPTLPEVFKAMVLKFNPIADKLSGSSFYFLFLSWVAFNIWVLEFAKDEIDVDNVEDFLREIIEALTLAVPEGQKIADDPLQSLLNDLVVPVS